MGKTDLFLLMFSLSLSRLRFLFIYAPRNLSTHPSVHTSSKIDHISHTLGSACVLWRLHQRPLALHTWRASSGAQGARRPPSRAGFIRHVIAFAPPHVFVFTHRDNHTHYNFWIISTSSRFTSTSCLAPVNTDHSVMTCRPAPFRLNRTWHHRAYRALFFSGTRLV